MWIKELGFFLFKFPFVLLLELVQDHECKQKKLEFFFSKLAQATLSCFNEILKFWIFLKFWFLALFEVKRLLGQITHPFSHGVAMVNIFIIHPFTHSFLHLPIQTYMYLVNHTFLIPSFVPPTLLNSSPVSNQSII